MAIQVCENFRSEVLLTRLDGETALLGMVQTDGITPHGVQGLFEDGHLIRLCWHVENPTVERLALARRRVQQALERSIAAEASVPDLVAEQTGAAPGRVVGDTLGDLRDLLNRGIRGVGDVLKKAGSAVGDTAGALLSPLNYTLIILAVLGVVGFLILSRVKSAA